MYVLVDISRPPWDYKNQYHSSASKIYGRVSYIFWAHIYITFSFLPIPVVVPAVSCFLIPRLRRYSVTVIHRLHWWFIDDKANEVIDFGDREHARVLVISSKIAWLLETAVWIISRYEFILPIAQRGTRAESHIESRILRAATLSEGKIIYLAILA